MNHQKRRIMFFIRSFRNGGAEKQLLEIIKRLNKDKYDITIYCRSKSGEYLNEFEKYANCRECFDYLTPGKNLLKKLYNFLILFFGEKCLKKFPNIYYRLAIKDTFDVEIAFKNDESTRIIASSKNKQSKKIQWIHTDMSIHTGWKYYFISKEERDRYLLKYDLIIGVSNHTVKSIQTELGITDKVMTVYNFINDKEVSLMADEPVELEFKNNYPIVACVGRLETEKRVEMIISVHKKLLDMGCFNNLLIVGTGTQLEKLKSMSDSLGVCDTVSFVGFQINPYKYIKKSDLLVCTSSYEGFHLASVEAMLLGKPVISCCPVFEEIKGNSDCGVFCTSSEDSIRDEICRLLFNQSKLKTMGNLAAERAAFFNGEYSVDQLESIFDNAGTI